MCHLCIHERNMWTSSVSMDGTCWPALYPWTEHVGQLCIHGLEHEDQLYIHRSNMWASPGWNMLASSVSMGGIMGASSVYCTWTEHGGQLCIHERNVWANYITMDGTCESAPYSWVELRASSIFTGDKCGPALNLGWNMWAALYPWTEHVGQLCIHGRNVWASSVSMDGTCGPALHPWMEHVRRCAPCGSFYRKWKTCGSSGNGTAAVIWIRTRLITGQSSRTRIPSLLTKWLGHIPYIYL